MSTAPNAASEKGAGMNSPKKQARVAGLLYLLAGITAPFGLMYVPRTLVVPGDATPIVPPCLHGSGRAPRGRAVPEATTGAVIDNGIRSVT